jgi:hypothetical protein
MRAAAILFGCSRECHAAYRRTIVASSSCARALTQLRYHRGGVGPDELQPLRYIESLVRSGGAIEPALADSMARDLAGHQAAVNPDFVGGGISAYGFHAAQIDLASRVLRHSLRAEFISAFQRGLASSWN